MERAVLGDFGLTSHWQLPESQIDASMRSGRKLFIGPRSRCMGGRLLRWVEEVFPGPESASEDRNQIVPKQGKHGM